MMKRIEDTTKPWAQHWQEVQDLQCQLCANERRRRTRVLYCDDLKDGSGINLPVGMPKSEAEELLTTERFAESVYITECNKPVCVCTA